MKWIKSFLNEPGTQEGSSQRLLLMQLVTVLLALLVYLTVKNGKLPEVPASLETLIEWIGTSLICGIGLGKGILAYRTVKGGDDAGQAAQ